MPWPARRRRSPPTGTRRDPGRGAASSAVAARGCSGSSRSSTITAWIDQRTITTNFAAEQTLTSDAVPVNVDAVLFWMVYDPEKAALEVQDYEQGRELGGADGAPRHHRPHAADGPAPRPRADRGSSCRSLIDDRSNPWGITVQSVEMVAT